MIETFPFAFKVKISALLVGSLFAGFFIGNISSSPAPAQPIVRNIQPEISIIRFKKLDGDLLIGDISGPVRILWGEKNLAEGEGDFEIPLGQISSLEDLKFQQFPYTGNVKTKKFYPSDSYFARGVEIRYRRFFETKQAAINAGFVASKGVK
ncbi:hypothetical protein K9L27_01435 [Candidatus Gracilibacteria bacterium]|nr:hypothetical protein [Candidatus Gracilibacteria bacterium]